MHLRKISLNNLFEIEKNRKNIKNYVFSPKSRYLSLALRVWAWFFTFSGLFEGIFVGFYVEFSQNWEKTGQYGNENDADNSAGSDGKS